MEKMRIIVTNYVKINIYLSIVDKFITILKNMKANL